MPISQSWPAELTLAHSFICRCLLPLTNTLYLPAGSWLNIAGLEFHNPDELAINSTSCSPTKVLSSFFIVIFALILLTSTAGWLTIPWQRKSEKASAIPSVGGVIGTVV